MDRTDEGWGCVFSSFSASNNDRVTSWRAGSQREKKKRKRKRKKTRKNLRSSWQKTTNALRRRVTRDAYWKNRCLFSMVLSIVLALNNHSGANSMCQLGSGEENEWTKMSSTEHNDSQRPPIVDEFLQRHDDMKYFVDLYTAALHLRLVRRFWWVLNSFLCVLLKTNVFALLI